MERSNIEKIAHTPEDRILLAKVWDKINAGLRRSIVSSTGFLSPRELEMTRFLFGDLPGLAAIGGYEEAERRMLVYLPDYLEKNFLQGEDSPLVCLRATYYEKDTLTHRDFLGALMGAGIGRECIGDICVANGSCDFFATAEIATYLLQNFTSAGRTKLRLARISLSEVQIPEPEVRLVKDTLASLRLDSLISAGFQISRGQATQFISAGKASVDSLPCEKADKVVSVGVKVSVRGLGKIKLVTAGSETKKGRIPVVIHRYI